MIKKWGLALLILCTTVTISGTSLAASNMAQIEVSKTSLDYSHVRPISDGAFHNGLLFAEQKDGTLVYYNTAGDKAFTLPTDIEPLSDFYEQRALVRNKTTKLMGYVNTKGKLAIPCQYASAGYFSEGVAHVTMADSNDEALIDRTGEIVTRLTTTYSSEYYFTNGLAVAYAPKDSKIGFINTSGELAINYKYAFSRGFSEGLALVQNNKGLYGYINTTGTTVIPFQYQSAGDFSEGWAPVQNAKGKWGFINKRGKVVIPFKYEQAAGFTEGLAIVYNADSKVGFINQKGKLVIGYQKYTRAFPFKEGIALVGIGTNSDSKFGYINRQGKLLTKLEYESASSSFNDGYAVALKELGTGFILTKVSASK
ncbi:hypothetical protein J2T13_001483 [Paenibacillus sp. DS2015]|uniref:WG repeat-containing protein n=1 Tax=Paenibacillus sp. DS2015 TaxID=3373917 RepID=UPI003D200711